MIENDNLTSAKTVLPSLGLPRAQQNERSALTLLALLNLTPDKEWSEAEDPLLGITPIIDWAREHYHKDYAANTRESVRKESMHQFVDAGIVLKNPDDPTRPVNSPLTAYRITPEALNLLKSFGSPDWTENLTTYFAMRTTLVQQHARERNLALIPVVLRSGGVLHMSAGSHSALTKAIVEQFAERFVPEALLIYVGDTGRKFQYFDSPSLEDLGVAVDAHGKMPDVVLFDRNRRWLVLVEAVTSRGPVDEKRHQELAALFSKATVGLVYVSAFPTRAAMARHLRGISWETEVWVADSPSHLIHFNGERYLGPY